MNTLSHCNIFSDMLPFATLITAIAALGALGFYNLQLFQTKRINRANFWLQLKQLFFEPSRFDIHIRIMENGLGDKISEKDSAIIDDYLGIFEICLLMINENVIDLGTFKTIYKYRLDYILRNELVVKEKLISEGKYYKKLFDLYSKVSNNSGWIEFWERKIFERRSESLDIERLYKEMKSDLIDKFLDKLPD